MVPHSSTLAWKIPWMEEPGGLQSMGSLRVGHNWVTSLSLFTFMHWRRKWQPTPVFLPGESQGQRSLVGCRLWGRTEPDTTEATYSSSSSRFLEERGKEANLGAINRRNTAKTSLKNKGASWNWLTLLLRFSPVGAYWGCHHLLRSFLLTSSYLTALFVFIVSVAAGCVYALLLIGCHWIVSEVMMIYLIEWYPITQNMDPRLQRAREIMKKGRTV